MGSPGPSVGSSGPDVGSAGGGMGVSFFGPATKRWPRIKRTTATTIQIQE